MYNTLYKRNTNGSIQQWRVEVVVDAYRTISGKYGSDALVISALTKCKPKNIGKANATTSREQCLLEVAAIYKKKLDSGYVEDITLLDANDIGLLKPMLAKEYSQYKAKIKFPVISSEKIDGLRCTATKDGLFSRNGKPFLSVPHIYEALKPIFYKYPNIVCDGEIFNKNLQKDFNKIISLARKNKPSEKDLLESANLIKFYIFDIFMLDGNEKLPAIERKKLVTALTKELNHPSIIDLGYMVCANQQELDNCYEAYLSDGAEGQMINYYDALYVHKRGECLLKRKEFKEDDFEIIDIVEGKGAREGAAILVLRCNKQTFQCSLTGTLEYMKDVYNNKHNIIGLHATVKFQDYTPVNVEGLGGIPRFPTCKSIRDYE
jgi:DNA ligase-1